MANSTKIAIRNSFIKLLNEKALNKITIRDIVDECGVNRNTFYYYYQDLPDLIDCIIKEDFQRVVLEHPTIQSLDECFDVALEFSLKNRKAVMHLYNSANRVIYERYQWKICTYIAEAFVDGLLGGQDFSDSDRSVLIEYWKCVSFGLIIGWLESGMKPESLDRMHRIISLKKGEPEYFIDKCKKNN